MSVNSGKVPINKKRCGCFCTSDTGAVTYMASLARGSIKMGFVDSATKRFYSHTEATMHRFDVNRCEVCIFILHDEPRVFIGGGKYGFDSLAREADLIEVEALAERFSSPALWEAVERMRSVKKD